MAQHAPPPAQQQQQRPAPLQPPVAYVPAPAQPSAPAHANPPPAAVPPLPAAARPPLAAARPPAAAAAPGAAGGLHQTVLGGTFLAGAQATVEVFLEVGKEVPMVGPLLMLMLVFIKALHQFRATEEECERLAVWVHALMGSFAKAAREGRVDADSTYLITAAETALQKLVTLVETRLDRAGGWFGKVKAFWTSAEFKEGMERAERGLHDALDALLMMVSVETRRDVAMVLDRAERLPFMDQKLDAVLETLQGVSDKVGGIDAKMDAAEARGKLMMQRLDEMQAGMKQRGGGSIFDTLTWAPFPRGEWLARGGDEEDEGEEDLSVLGTGTPPPAPLPAFACERRVDFPLSSELGTIQKSRSIIWT